MRRFTPTLIAALLTATLGSLYMGSFALMMVMVVLVVAASWPLLFRRLAAANLAWSPPASVEAAPGASMPRERSRDPERSGSVRALGRVEARELAGSAWFGVGIGFSLLLNVLFAVVWGKDDAHLWPDETMLAAWFVHPLVGMTILAVHRNVTRARRDGTDELFDTCPTTPTTRTWGFLAAAWVPLVTAAAFYLAYLAILMGRGVHFDGPFGIDQILDLAGALVLCIGGVALGVALGRWVRFGLAPVITVVAVGFLSLGIATRGDPHWNPIAELSTFPPIENIEQLFLARHTGGHVLWLLALTGIVVVVALARHRRDRSLALTAAALVALAAAAGILATRPVSGSDAAAIADMVMDPASHQTCLTGGDGRVQVCTFDPYDDIGQAVLEPVSAIGDALPAEAGVITMRQRFVEGATLADLPPAVRDRFPQGLPRRAPGEIPLEFGFDKYAVAQARFDVAFAAVGLPTAPTPTDEPRVIAGQARGVIALWLATRGMEHADATATATAFHPDSEDPFARGLAWYEGCGTPPVVWSGQDLQATRALMEVPDDDVTRVLSTDWTRWIDPSTGTDELMAAAGLPAVGPFDRIITRAETLGC